MEKLEEMKQLVDKLNYYSFEYYNNSNSIVSDETFDKLFDDLKKLEKETNVILSNSPTINVGCEIIDNFKKVNHKFPMKSLDKTKDIKQIIEFANNKEIVIMHKLDGLTVELVYKNGELIEASTRGNGFIGDNITHNAKVFSNIPLKIKNKDELHIIGEAIIEYDTFNKINENVEKKYKNPRNLVSGTVKNLDSNICKSRKVKFISYIIYGSNIDKKVEQIKYLKELGFDTVEYKLLTNGNIVNNEIEKLKTIAEEKRLPIDGIVITYNDIKYGESLGDTAHHPLHSLAFKFNDDVEITILNDITYQVGRTGQITPIAWFDPVELEGTTVRKASIHNLAKLKELKLGIGDRISVYKANQIIPQVKDNLDCTNTIDIIDKCPICGSKLVIRKSNNSEFLYCENNKCEAKIGRIIQHYCSKQAMNIIGISLKSINKFVEKGFIKDSCLDIYDLKKYKNEIIDMDGFGEKSYNKLINSIEKSKNCELYNFLFALGISNVGKETSKDLCKHFNNDFYKIANSNFNEYVKINGIGEKVGKNIEMFFDINSKTRNEAIKLYEKLNIIEEEKIELNEDQKFKNLKIYCTGKFANFNKKQLEDIVKKNGGIYANGYNKKLDYLVVGSLKSSTKEKMAKDDGIKILSEDEFINIIKG